MKFYTNSGAVIAGIVIGLASEAVAAILLVIVLLALHLIWRKPEEPYFRWPVVLSVALAVGSLLYGYTVEMRNQSALPDHLDTAAVTLRGEIASPITVDGDRVSFQLRAEELVTTSGNKATFVLRGEHIQTTIYLDAEFEQREALTWRRGMALQLAGELRKPGTARNFGDFDYREYLRTHRIHWQLTSNGLQAVDQAKVTSGFSMNRIAASIERFRSRLATLVQSLYDERYTGFMQGLLIGDRSELPQDMAQQFSDIGMTHVLAISGLHVGVFTAGCFWLLRSLRLSQSRVYAITCALVPVYVLSTGAAPSAVRAGIMALLGLAAAMRGRLKDSHRYVMIAAMIMLVWDPYYAHQVSFQLSFLVTFGLIIGVPRLLSWLPARPKPLYGALAVTIVAQLYSFPLVIGNFHIVHGLSPLANLVLVPLVSLFILPLGMLSLVGAVWHEALGLVPAKLASFAANWLFRAVEWTAGQDDLLMVWPGVPFWWTMAYYGLVTILLVYGEHLRLSWSHRAARATSIALCAALSALLIYGYAGDHWDRTGIVSVLDVGQGDAILIRTPQGKHVLIDGGGTFRFGQHEEWRMRRDPYEVGEDLLVPLLRGRGVHRLDAIVATHLDADHIGGLHAVVEKIPTERIVWNGTKRDTVYYERLSQAAQQRHIPFVAVASGMEWQPDGDTKLLFLHPPVRDAPGAVWPLVDDQNAASIVVLLTMHDSVFLLTGDIGHTEELAILQTVRAIDVMSSVAVDGIDVLKIAHHGSKYSSSERWLDYWRPKTGVISVGRNFYGHPSPDVLARLAERDVPALRTDQHGEVQFSVRRDNLYVRKKYGD